MTMTKETDVDKNRVRDGGDVEAIVDATLLVAALDTPADWTDAAKCEAYLSGLARPAARIVADLAARWKAAQHAARAAGDPQGWETIVTTLLPLVIAAIQAWRKRRSQADEGPSPAPHNV